MEGQFIQFGPTGDQSEGVFFMSRPGKIRFHYSAPSRLDVISDGSSVAIEDGRANTQQLYPLSKTPLRYLLSDQIDLTSDQLVDSVREEPDLISVLIVEKSALVEGKLALIFDRKTYELRQWIVTDAQGLNTSVAIYNVTTGKQPRPDPLPHPGQDLAEPLKAIAGKVRIHFSVRRLRQNEDRSPLVFRGFARLFPAT